MEHIELAKRFGNSIVSIIAMFFCFGVIAAECDLPVNQFCVSYYDNINLEGTPVLQRYEENINHDWGHSGPLVQPEENQFSAKWQGQFDFDGGEYRFIVQGDDSIRVWVDNVLIIDRWDNSGSLNLVEGVIVNQGRHSVIVEYRDQWWVASAKVDWELANPDCDVPEGRFCATYFLNTDLDGFPILRQEEPEIAHNWDLSGPQKLEEEDQFSGHWIGKFAFTEGKYTFTTRGNDGIRLWLDGALVIDSWNDYDAGHQREINATVDVDSGLHEVEVAFYDKWWVASLDVSWVKTLDNCDFPEATFCAEYFFSNTLEGPPDLRTIENEINHDWQFSGPQGLAEENQFGARWRGTFAFDAGPWEFVLKSDDKFSLRIDGELMLDVGDNNTYQEYRQMIEMTAGLHQIEVSYIEEWWKANIAVKWISRVPHLPGPQVMPNIPLNTLNQIAPLGTNLDWVSYWSTSWMFVDAMKRSSKWLTQCNDWAANPCQPQSGQGWDTQEQNLLDLDENGWVRSLPTTDDPNADYRWVTKLIYFDNNEHYPMGRYTVLYDGEGVIEYNHPARIIDELSVPGRDVVEIAETSPYGFQISIKSTDPNNTGNHLRNIRIILPGGLCNNDTFSYCDQTQCSALGDECTPFEDVYENQIFHPLHLQDMRKYRAIRFSTLMRGTTINTSTWEERTAASDHRWSTANGLPIEIFLEYTKRLNADAWLNVPAKADDDFVEEFAQLAKAALLPSQKIYVEYHNEVWNVAYPFENIGAWVQTKALELWPNSIYDGHTTRLNWFAKRTVEICRIFKTVWADQADLVSCVMGAQAGNSWLAQHVLDCPLWAPTNGGKACGSEVDMVAIANYFGHYLGYEQHENKVNDWLADADGGLSLLFDELTGGGLLYDESHPENQRAPEFGALARATDDIRVYKPWVDKYGLKLVAYEGGQHMIGVGTVLDNEDIRDLFHQANRDSRMKDVYTAYLQAWQDEGGSLLLNFLHIGRYSKWGSWGIKEYQGEISTPKLDAVLEFNETVPCWWNDCLRY